MPITSAILLSILLVSLVSLVGVFLLSLHERFLKKAMPYLVSFSTGALLGNVFLHILPELALEGGGFEQSLFIVLIGFLFSFVLEKFIYWRHCHDMECASHVHPVGSLILVGDAAHNIIDGVLITTAYLVSIPLGMATTLAVLLHEIPQEFGDFAVLIHSGYSKTRALIFNFISALFAFIGAALVLVLARDVSGLEMLLLPLVAGNFLYIAGSDLIPELHRESHIQKSLWQLFWMIAGIGVMWGI